MSGSGAAARDAKSGAEAEVKVYVSEEYGYRTWVWYPKMSEKELIAWWEALPTVLGFFFTGAAGLPGEAKQVDADTWPTEYPLTVHLHEDDDSFLNVRGKLHRNAGYARAVPELEKEYEAEAEVACKKPYREAARRSGKRGIRSKRFRKLLAEPCKCPKCKA